jgi:hypothetical protein
MPMPQEPKQHDASSSTDNPQPDSPQLDSPQPPSDHGRARGKDRAAERIAAALRDNLKRRKAANKPKSAAPEPKFAAPSIPGSPED